MKYRFAYEDFDKPAEIEYNEGDCVDLWANQLLYIVREDQVLVSPREFAERVNELIDKRDDEVPYWQWSPNICKALIAQVVAELEGEGV